MALADLPEGLAGFGFQRGYIDGLHVTIYSPVRGKCQEKPLYRQFQSNGSCVCYLIEKKIQYQYNPAGDISVS